jgi:aryl-alcohol dehydrogenase-like predicted oxidoreductase
VLTRVVDYGGLFWGDVKPGHTFKPGDHRTYRPGEWVQHGWDKIQRMAPIAERHGLSLIELACYWNLAQPAVKSLVPTVIQEATEDAPLLEEKIRQLGNIRAEIPLSAEEIAEITRIGDNTGCMMLKGASKRHEVSQRADEWPMRPELLAISDKWSLGREW